LAIQRILGTRDFSRTQRTHTRRGG
jgi:hypothetical protein